MNPTTFVVAAISFALISCGSGNEGTPVKETGTTTTSAGEKKKGLSFKVGEDVTFGDFVIKVNKVADYEATEDFMKPEKGMKLIAVEVEYNNPTTDKQLTVSSLDWKASDNDGYSYEGFGPYEQKEPMLAEKTLNPGGKVKGWLTFSIPVASKLARAQFQPDLLDEGNVEFVFE